MNRYVLDIKNECSVTVASKARFDSEEILEEMGFEKKNISINVQSRKGKFISTIQSIKKQLELVLDSLDSNSILLIQYPWDKMIFGFAKLIRNKTSKKNIKTILLIHDLNGYRTGSKITKIYYNFIVKEYKYINLFDYVICHNHEMKNHLLLNGVFESKLKVLKLFDYLTENKLSENKRIKFTEKNIRQVIVAGNLSKEKAGYLYNLSKLHIGDFNFLLYGPKFKGPESKKVKYGGIVPSDDLPNILYSGFGLVWDGERTDTCSGAFGNYLKINNPYKFSLYMASGLPVIVWSQSALAKFVKKNSLGFVISDLSQLNSLFQGLTLQQYKNLKKNVDRIQKKICQGGFLKEIILSIEDEIKK